MAETKFIAAAIENSEVNAGEAGHFNIHIHSTWHGRERGEGVEIGNYRSLNKNMAHGCLVVTGT